MHASTTSSLLFGKSNKFEPTVKQASGSDMFVFRIAIMSFLLFFMVMSCISISISSPATTVFAPPQETTIVSQDSNIITYSLSENVAIAEGNVGSYRGFAYHLRDTDVVYFVDPIQDITFEVSVPDGTIQTQIEGADIDDDGSTEFIFSHRDSSTLRYELVMVDFDGTPSYTTHYDIPNWYPGIEGFGDFNGDGFLDVYLRHNAYKYHTTFDIENNVTIGQWNTTEYGYYNAIGKFHDGAKDYLALGINTAGYRNISIFDGYGNLINQLDHPYLKDIDTIDHGDVADDLVVIDVAGNASIYHGENLTLAFEVSVRAPTTGNFFVHPANITLDEFEDFYAFERYDEQAYMVDGKNGTLLYVVDGVVLGTSTKPFDVGEIDADQRTDALIKDISGSPGLLRGADGVVSYIETLIEEPLQYIVHEVSGDSKEDMLLRVVTDLGADVYIIVSDTQAPILIPSPLNPLHPTVLDDYITVEVEVDERSTIDMTHLYYRDVGDLGWIEPHDGLFSTLDGITHFAFLVGLDGGNYEYYIQFRDSFLNVAEIGSSVTPETFTVQGNLVWESTPAGSAEVFFLKSRYRLAEGNMTNGSTVIYTARPTVALDKIRLNKYDEYGVLLNYTELPGFFGYDYAVVSGNFDGDNVTDPVVLLSEKVTDATAYIFHGSNFTSNYNCTIPQFAKIYDQVEVSDVDFDGLDEIILVTITEPLSMSLMDDDGTWSTILLPFSDQHQLRTDAMAVGRAALVSDTHIILERDENRLEIYRASDLSQVGLLIPDYGSYTAADIVDIEVFHNASLPYLQFLVEFRLWDGTNPYTAFAIVDGYTTSLSVDDMYIIPDRVHRYGHVYDVDADGIDEIFIISTTGEISLVQLDPSLTIEWTSTITDSTPLVSLITDFLGDGTQQLALFTDEDERLTIIDFRGIVQRDLYIGEVHGAFEISSIDAGDGNEIAAFPIMKDGESVIGAIRDLDWYYRLNVSAEYSPTNITQNTPLTSSVEVRNIYGEVIEDATVSMNVHYFEEGSQRASTSGFYYNDSSNLYQTMTEASWPIGLANLSFHVEHAFYHRWEQTYQDAVTISSPLNVQVITDEFVVQGGNQTIQVIVTDSRGIFVTDANVTIEIDGTQHSTSITEPFYEYMEPSVSLEIGTHEVIATADHQYSPVEKNVTKKFIVQTISEDLVIVDNFPRTVIQDEHFVAWFNITDVFGYPISEAEVALTLGPRNYRFFEDLSTPGCYRFEGELNLVMGNQTLNLLVSKQDITNPNAMEVQLDVYGELDPIIQAPEIVEAGRNITISVFMRDPFGPVTQGANVIVQIGGTNYTAIQDPVDLSAFRVRLEANLPAGVNEIYVFAEATYDSNGWVNSEPYGLSVSSYANIIVTSSLSWEISQGNTTRIQANVTDWLGNPVSSSTVTMYLGVSSYVLTNEGSGIYAVNVDTSGWHPEPYAYDILLQDDYVRLDDTVSGILTVRGILDVTITVETDSPTENQPLLVTIEVHDVYGNPIEGLSLSVTLGDQVADEVNELDEAGRYEAIFYSVNPQNWGYKEIIVTAESELCFQQQQTLTIQLNAATPDLAMDIPSVSITAGAAFLLSFIGMFIYFKMASSMRVQDESKENLKRSVRRMDRLYGTIVGATGIGAVASYFAYLSSNNEVAVVLAIVILGASVLLYGLWLYRDAVASIMVNDKLNRRRMVVGLWHLFFLPMVIVMILVYGAEINWFNQHVIAASFQIGDISIPSITTTIVTSFASSIIVVVFNVYREISQGIKKLDKMESAGTPIEVMKDERSLMVKKFSSSIRIKFLMFLVVVGGATVIALDTILAQYSIAVVVLIVVLFLIVIPFLSSKIMKALGIIGSKISGERKESGNTSEEL